MSNGLREMVILKQILGKMREVEWNKYSLLWQVMRRKRRILEHHKEIGEPWMGR